MTDEDKEKTVSEESEREKERKLAFKYWKEITISDDIIKLVGEMMYEPTRK